MPETTGQSDPTTLQHKSPKVLVLGDSILDLFVYDRRAEAADKSLAWTSPLSRDDWYYAAGFETRWCVAGAAAIQAMLCKNAVPAAGNSFRNGGEQRALEKSGSIFILRQKPDAGKAKNNYLVTRPETQEHAKSEHEHRRAALAGKEAHLEGMTKDKINQQYIKVSEDRDQTWRAGINLLSAKDVRYLAPIAADALTDFHANGGSTASLKAVCLWDVDRGSFHQRNSKNWESQQNDLLKLYKDLCSDGNKPAIVIRTSDPKHFERFLTKLTESGKEHPIVIFVCALAQLKDGDLRVSGTWSGVWRQLYDCLKDESYLFHSENGDGNRKPNWKFHIVIPVYQDGVIWIGPDCWPIDDSDHIYIGEDRLPIGRLFMVPGAQPGLSEFEEQGSLIGVHTLLTHAILERLVEQDGAATAEPGELARAKLDRPIRQGLLRIRRLRNRGYGGPSELTSLKSEWPDLHIAYPCEVWRKSERDVTDFLLDVDVTDHESSRSGGADDREFAGPYEVKCKVDPIPLRIFHTIEKKIGGEFVASPRNCILIVGDVSSKKYGNPINDHWIKINNKAYPIDSFSKLVIETSWLRRRISMQFNDFAMADPKEAGSILDLAQRVKQHVASNRYNSPDKGSVFNFALFGSPGSGKSFLAREIAASIDARGETFTRREWNISQFTDPAQLTDAFKVIASESVGAKVPLVLWDEFDSVLDGERGGWLARFLMPMQDAHFFDGRERRPIGTAVFVFIGGTFPTAQDFRNWACETERTKDGRPPDSVLLKARDFHSRLYTALDMPRIIDEEEPASVPSQRCQKFTTEWVNSYAKLARAVLLRHYFRERSKIGQTSFLEEIDKDLCRFLLAIPLRHGARSLERVVEACLVSKPSKLSMMHLPPNHFLEEHIETGNVRNDGSERIGMTIDEMKRLAAPRR
jgi:ATPase family protein associated with various cellular activities (AAA)